MILIKNTTEYNATLTLMFNKQTLTVDYPINPSVNELINVVAEVL